MNYVRYTFVYFSFLIKFYMSFISNAVEIRLPLFYFLSCRDYGKWKKNVADHQTLGRSRQVSPYILSVILFQRATSQKRFDPRFRKFFFIPLSYFTAFNLLKHTRVWCNSQSWYQNYWGTLNGYLERHIQWFTVRRWIDWHTVSGGGLFR